MFNTYYGTPNPPIQKCSIKKQHVSISQKPLNSSFQMVLSISTNFTDSVWAITLAFIAISPKQMSAVLSASCSIIGLVEAVWHNIWKQKGNL